MLQVKHYRLPADGVIRGARGYKKQVIPAGTKVYCIVYGTLMFWSAFLNEEQALKCIDGLLHGRNTPDLKEMLAWNFKSTFPLRIARPKEV